VIVVTLVSAALGAMTVLVLRCPVLAARPGGVARPGGAAPRPVSVIIPARDEVERIGLLLTDLTHRADVIDNVEREIIVVDDESTDATAPLAAAAGARVTSITADSRPAGWNPKVWALHVGASLARHDELVFLDADVRLAPGALDAVVAARQRAGGLLSVAPHHRAVGPVEALSALCNVIVVAGGGPGVTRRATGAVGSCLAMARDDYRRIGGHGAVPATIVDDLDLAASARRAGLAVALCRGGPLVGVRSYPGGLRAVADGWSKNLAAGMRRTPPARGLVVGGWISAVVLPLALVAQRRWLAAGAAWAVVAVHTGWLSRRVGDFDRLATSVGAPLIGAFTTLLTARSLLLALTRRPVRWKGRALRPDGTALAGGPVAGVPR
jgi:4,4'-diaponeurosporenoate glycosyltransferase